MKTVPRKGAEDSKELAPALSHSYWLNSLDYFGSRHSAAFLIIIIIIIIIVFNV